ncbi:hypothetical protein [Picosynechococcus sp. NKBG15041c]|uniref:hypothetical protein n=1 Tax=Picosynechococcus sp. NKBG15041c TaxID=1407650 RepID=UPI0003F97AA6|nr:hypothetical protein [Picosynechococcus sp. NKBG15041c]
MKKLVFQLLGCTTTIATASLLVNNPAVADTVSGAAVFVSGGDAISAYALELDSPGSRFNSAELNLGYRPLDVGQLFNVGNTLYGNILNPGTTTGLVPPPEVPGATGIGSLAAFLAQNNLTVVGGAPKIQETIAQLNQLNDGTGVNLDEIQWTLATANSICAGDLTSLTPAENPVCLDIAAVAPITVTNDGFVVANVELTGSFDPTVILSDFLEYAEFVSQDVRNSSIVLANGVTAAELAPYIDGILQYAILEATQGGASLEQVIATVFDNPNLTTDTKNAIFQALSEGGYLEGLSANGNITDIEALLGFDINDVNIAAGLLSAIP